MMTMMFVYQLFLYCKINIDQKLHCKKNKKKVFLMNFIQYLNKKRFELKHFLNRYYQNISVFTICENFSENYSKKTKV